MKKNKRVLALFLTVMLVLSPLASFPVMGAGEMLTVSDLRVENLNEPLGVDTKTPAFRWLLSSDGYGKSQSAYQIIVSTTEAKANAGEGDMWDSGKQSGENNYDVLYDGKPLESRTKYYWSVQVWDEADAVSGWSEVSSFETGIMDTDDWRGEWIGITTSKMTFEGANWIWKMDDGADYSQLPEEIQYFRQTFRTDPSKTISNVYIGITADDEYVLYLNGEIVGENGGVDSWNNGILYDVTSQVSQSSDNLIAASVYNTSQGYAGLLGKIEITYSDGSTDVVVTDGSWNVSRSLENGWVEPDHDDSEWVAPTQILAYGSSPWGTGVTPNAQNAFAATVLRKEFTLDDEIESARAYVAGLGFFEMKINGQLPDDTVMNPANTQYTQTVLYRVFDVTDLVDVGDNAIGIELGNSFYNEDVSVWNWQAAAWRDEPKLNMELVVTYKNGSRQVITTDGNWKGTKDGPITTNSIYYGETYDARKELIGYDSVGYTDGDWGTVEIMEAPAGELKAQMMEPIRRTYESKPKSVDKVELGDGSYTYVITAPEMLAGWIELTIRDASEGDKITITYGEKLESDGQVQKLGGSDGVSASWWPKDYNQQDKYICKGDAVEVYEPKFSYKGYEYVQVDGYPGELTIDDVICYRTSNDMEITGSFDSSNSLFNKMHDMMVTTMSNNMQGKPTDTPVWEKNGWLGDANVSLSTMTYNYGFAPMLEQFLQTMMDANADFGTIPNMVPTQGWGSESNVIVWNSLFVLGTSEMLDVYGMESLVLEEYDNMRDYALRCIYESENWYGWTWDGGQLADWVAPMGQGDENSGLPYEEWNSEGSGIAGTGYLYRVLGVMEELAERFGKTDDTEIYRDAMEHVYSAFNEKFYNEEKQIYETGIFDNSGNKQHRTEYRQTSQLVPLAFGLVPEAYEEAVVINLVKDIREKNYHLDTGCVGTALILPVLCDYGYSDIAYKIANQTSYPSWGYMAERGTSLWEMWEDTARSLGHYFLGTYDEWFFSGIGGIKDAKNGYKTFTVEPIFNEDLDWGDVSVETVRGAAATSWELLNQSQINIAIQIPVGSETTVILPGETVTSNGTAVSSETAGIRSVSVEDGKTTLTIGSGSYVFETEAIFDTTDKIDLKSAIIKAQALNEIDYDKDAWSVLMEVLDRAVAVRDDAEVEQSVIDTMTAELEAALDEIENHINQYRVDLRETVAAAEQVNPVAHPLPYVYAYEDAYEAAANGCENAALSDSELEELKNDLLAAQDDLDANAYANLALNKDVDASTSHEDSYWGWGANFLTDGDRKNANDDGEYTGYSSSTGNTGTDHAEWVSIDLGNTQLLNAVTLYPATQTPSIANSCYGFPRTFEIQVSDDNANWTTVIREENYPVPSYGPICFVFEEVEARYIKLDAESLNPKITDHNFYYLQMTEFEVYHSVDTLGAIEVNQVTEPQTQLTYGGKLLDDTTARAVLDRTVTVDGEWEAFDSDGTEVDLGEIQEVGSYILKLTFQTTPRYAFADNVTANGITPTPQVSDNGRSVTFTYQVEVVKAAAPLIPDYDVYVSAAAGGSREVNLAESAGIYDTVLGYAIGDISALADIFEEVPAVDKNGTVTFKVKEGQALGSFEIPVTVSFQNYEASTVIINLYLTEQIPVTISFEVDDKTYDKAPYAGPSGITAVITDDDKTYEGALNITYQDTDENMIDAPIDAGAYRVTVSVDDPEYAGQTTKEFQILPKQASVKATDKKIQTGDDIPDLTAPKKGTDYLADGLLDGDILTVDMAYLDGDGNEVTPDPSEPGIYKIGISADAGANYHVTAEGGTLTIAQRTYQITVENGTANQSEAPKGAEITIVADSAPEGYAFTGWVGSEGVAFADSAQPTTIFIMPDSDVIVTAVYEKTDEGGSGKPGTSEPEEPGGNNLENGGSSVNTGDDSRTLIIILIVVLAMTGAAGAFILIKRRRSQD